jgi:hypothetical protein
MLDTQHAKLQKRYGGEATDGLRRCYVRFGTDFVAEVIDQRRETAEAIFLEKGMTREPAPGTQELLGQLIQAWIDSGAECP